MKIIWSVLHTGEYLDRPVNYHIARSTTGTDELAFQYYSGTILLELEDLIEADGQTYVITEHTVDHATKWAKVYASVNTRSLEGVLIQPQTYQSQSVMNLVSTKFLAPNGWTLHAGSDVNVTMTYTVDKAQTPLDCILDLQEQIGFEMRLDATTKTLLMMQTISRTTNERLTLGVNAKSLITKGDSHEYYNAIKPIGADGLTITSVNGGSEILSINDGRPMKVIYWEDNRYTVPQSLKDKATQMLQEASIAMAYEVEVGVQALSYDWEIGDHLLVDVSGQSVDLRIMDADIYPDEMDRSTIRMASKSAYDRSKTIQKTITATVDNKLIPVYTKVQAAQTTADGKNTIYYGTQTPSDPVLNDYWHYPVGNGGTELRRYNGATWDKVISTEDVDEAQNLAEQANSEAQQAISKSDSALMQINTAVSNAGFSTLDELIQDMDGNIVSLESNVNGLQSTVGNASSGLVSQVTQLSNGLNALVTDYGNLEIGGANLIPNSSLAGNYTGFTRWASSNATQRPDHIRVAYAVDNQAIGITTPSFAIEQGKEYTLSFDGASEYNTNSLDYMYIIKDTGNVKLTNIPINAGDSNFRRYSLTFEAPETHSSVKLLVATQGTTMTSKGFKLRKVQVEEGNVATAYKASLLDYATQAQLSVLSDNINLRVTKADLIGEINIQAGNTLIRQGDNKLNITSTTTYIDSGTIKSAMIANGQIGTAHIGTIDASVANIINLNVGNLVANKSAFIEALFNGIYSSLKATSTGIEVNRTDGSRSIRLDDKGISLYAYSGIQHGYLGITYENGLVTGTSLISYEGNEIILGIQGNRETGAYTKAFSVGLEDNADFYVNVLLNNKSLNTGGGTIHTGGGKIDLSVGMDSSYPYIQNVSGRTEIGGGGISILRVGSAAYKRIDALANMALNGYHLQMNGGLIFTGGGYIDMSRGATSKNWIQNLSDRICIGGEGLTVLKIGRGDARFLDAYADFNLNGYALTGQSDSRLKKNITQWRPILEDVREMYFARYEWIDPNMPEGHHYGIIAQSAPLLSLQGEDGYLRLDNTLETHVALKGVQELLIVTDRLEERIRRLEENAA